jgi:hypothetical protein
MWQKPHNEVSMSGAGNQDLLELPMTAFFASRYCPGAAIRAAMEWALHLAGEERDDQWLHSSLEQSVLKSFNSARLL